MSWKTTYIEESDAVELCEKLTKLGYKTSVQDCTEYGVNIVRTHGGADPVAAAEVASAIAEVLELVSVGRKKC